MADTASQSIFGDSIMQKSSTKMKLICSSENTVSFFFHFVDDCMMVSLELLINCFAASFLD